MRRLIAAAITVTVVLSALVGAPTAAGAQGSDVDGCTAVPDRGRTFDFSGPCDDHDRCYLDRPHGDSADARRRCDVEFLAAMNEQCAVSWPDRSDAWSRRSCKAVAWVYYVGVRLFGGLAWDSGATSPVAV